MGATLETAIRNVLADHQRHCVDDPCDCGFTEGRDPGTYLGHLAAVIARRVEKRWAAGFESAP